MTAMIVNPVHLYSGKIRIEKYDEFFSEVLILLLMAGLPNSLNGALINGTASNQPAITVRAEEALIVVLVLTLWIAAIALFFNRWGKIRMLEPYQPKFVQQHRPSCPLVSQSLVQPRSFSKFNLNGDMFLGHQKVIRPRQNSVFVDSSAMTLPVNAPRKVKSAFDLQNLVLSDPALNKSSVKINFNEECLRRQSLFTATSKKSSLEPGQVEYLQHVKERRLSFRDLVDMERSQRCERVQCYVEREPMENDVSGTSRKSGESKQLPVVSSQSSVADSRHNSITVQDIKCCSKFPYSERRNSLLPAQADVTANFREPEGNECRNIAKTNAMRRSSMFLVNSLETERNFLNSRDNIKSGVIDFRRNSMLIINNLAEDMSCRLPGRDCVLGGSNMTLSPDYGLSGRRSSLMLPSGYEGKPKLSISSVAAKPNKGMKVKLGQATEAKHSNRKPSKSLDCGDPGKALLWRNSKKEESREAKKQFLTPSVPQNLTGSSTSLNFYNVDRREVQAIEESQSTGNLSVKSTHLKTNESKYNKPEGEKQSGAATDETERFGQNDKEGAFFEDQSARKPGPKVNLASSLINLKITSGTLLNVVTATSDSAKKSNGILTSEV